jgi:hypothetical protein
MAEPEIRQKLLSDLLSAVQQCQVRFGGKSELATETEEVLDPIQMPFNGYRFTVSCRYAK